MAHGLEHLQHLQNIRDSMVLSKDVAGSPPCGSMCGRQLCLKTVDHGECVVAGGAWLVAGGWWQKTKEVRRRSLESSQKAK